MSIQKRNIPPVILRLVNAPLSALENLLPLTSMGKNAAPQVLSVQAEENFDRFILSQYLMYLYISIFVFPETSFVYKRILDDGMTSIRSQMDKVMDKSLRDLIKMSIYKDASFSSEAMHLLESVILRVQPTKVYPTMSNIISVVLAVYGRWRPIKNTIVVHSVSLQKIEGYDEPAFVLSPCFDTTIDTAGFEGMPSLFWKLIFSFNIRDHLPGPGNLTQVLMALSSLALPLDPSSLTKQMQQMIGSDGKAGIPFINYLAMYFRELNMGLNYDLSPLADARRILMKRAHQFCGVGGTCISDFMYANAFLNYLRDVDDDDIIYSDEDRDLLKALSKGRPDDVSTFTKKIVYEEALEAAKSGTTSPDKTTKIPKSAAITKKAEDAFSDDSDTLDTSTETPQSDNKNSDDIIDRTSDVGQDSAAANVKVFLPLALPTETIDDHLLRLMVLRYVDGADQDPAPDITPENLVILKYWCERWLFIASIDQTKKLLVQLKLSDQLKELVV